MEIRYSGAGFSKNGSTENILITASKERHYDYHRLYCTYANVLNGELKFTLLTLPIDSFDTPHSEVAKKLFPKVYFELRQPIASLDSSLWVKAYQGHIKATILTLIALDFTGNTQIFVGANKKITTRSIDTKIDLKNSNNIKVIPGTGKLDLEHYLIKGTPPKDGLDLGIDYKAIERAAERSHVLLRISDARLRSMEDKMGAVAAKVERGVEHVEQDNEKLEQAKKKLEQAKEKLEQAKEKLERTKEKLERTKETKPDLEPTKQAVEQCGTTAEPTNDITEPTKDIPEPTQNIAPTSPTKHIEPTPIQPTSTQSRIPGIPLENYYTFNKETGIIERYNDNLFPRQQCVTVPAKIEGIDVKAIGLGAFANTGMSSVYIQDGIEQLGKKCFSNCQNLEHICLPNTLTLLNEQCFHNCGALETIEIPAGTLVIRSQCFSKCQKLANINLPSSLKLLETCAFHSLDSLETLTIPGNIKSVPEKLCEMCKNLETLIFSNGIESIPANLLSCCWGLRTVQFPSTISSISTEAFGQEGKISLMPRPISITLPYNPMILANAPFGANRSSEIKITNAPFKIVTE